MTLFPPSGTLKPLEPAVCWESDLQIRVGERVLPVHRGVLTCERSRFLADLFEPELSSYGEPVVVQPPHPELLPRALHALTTGARPEVTEAEFVGFVRVSSFLQSDELDLRLCEVGIAAWRSLTRLEDFRNPAVPPQFLERLLLLAQEHELMDTSEALLALALWSMDELNGGDVVLERLVAQPSDIEATELTNLQRVNPRFVELMTPTAVFQIMRRGMDSFI